MPTAGSIWVFGLLLMSSQALLVPKILAALSTSPIVDAAAVPFWLGLLLFVFVMDLGEYLFHRAQHAIPFLWRMHSLHHSDPNMTATTAERHFWADPIVKAVTIWPLAAAIVAPTATMVGAYSAISLWHFVVHANIRLDLGRWSWLLNSPAYHRRHHSAEPEHFGSNYAALFPIFDLLSGAYRRPVGYPRTGLPERPRTFAAALTWPLR